MVDKASKKVICTNFCNGKRHDLKLLETSRVRCKLDTKLILDSGYQGLQKIHANTDLPKKKTKSHPLTKEEKRENKQLSSARVLNENVIGMLKRFRIIADKYRNRRRRFGLRFNLISGVYNWELG